MVTISRKRNLNQLETCQKYAHKLSWNACTWHELVDLTFFGHVNKLARSVNKWTGACDKRLARLISYIHHTSDSPQYCHVGNTAQRCRLGLLQDSDFCWWPWRFKINLGKDLVYLLRSNICVSVSWMCQKQTSVSHTSTESLIITLDAGFRINGLPALDLWDVVMEVLQSSKSTESATHEAPGNCSRTHKSKPKQKVNRDVDQLSHVDYHQKRKFLSRRVSVVHLWRQWSSDQNDH